MITHETPQGAALRKIFDRYMDPRTPYGRREQAKKRMRSFGGYRTRKARAPTLEEVETIEDALAWLQFDHSGRLHRDEHANEDLDTLAAHVLAAVNTWRSQGDGVEEELEEEEDGATNKRRGPPRENEHVGNDAWREGATHSDEADFESDLEEEQEDEEDMTTKSAKGFETLRTVAKSAAGMQEITKGILASTDGGGLSKAEWDQLLIDHAEATGKRLDDLITKNRDLGRACDIIAKANGLLPTVY
jgi:hypothetical protein